MTSRLRASWQLLFHDGCRFAVPLSWHPDPDEAFARAPDGSSLSIQMLKTTNWAAHKAEVSRAYARPKVVHEDSSRRLWLEIVEGSRLQRRIADSIGLAPENWPPEDQ